MNVPRRDVREWIVDGGASVLIGRQAIGTGFDVKHVEAVLDWGARYDMQQLVRGPGRAARAAREVESRGYGITHWSGLVRGRLRTADIDRGRK